MPERPHWSGRRPLLVVAVGALASGVATLGGAGRTAAELVEPEHDPEQVGRLAEDVLSRPEFLPREPSLVDRALSWVGERLAELFLRAFGVGSGGSSLLSIAFLVAVVGAAVALAVNLRAASRRRRPTHDDEAWLAVDEVRDATGWDEAAAAAEAAGDWREGLRCRFGALTTRLGDRGLLPPEPGRTTGEHRADVRRSLPAAADDFAAAAELFDRAWYGRLPTGPDEARRFAAAAAAVLAVEAEPERRPVLAGGPPVAPP